MKIEHWRGFVDRYPPESPAKSGSGSPEPGFSREILTVSQLNRTVAGLLERSLPLIWVSGELSNLTRAASGHWYFSLKDAGAQVRAVMFRGRTQRVDFVPRDGDRVEVRALVTLYEPRGDFQLGVEVMRRAGAGDLHQRFLELKAKLQAEGLFDASRKRGLPRQPRCIGIVTSPQAAALRDVLTTLSRRAPQVPVVIYPALVQGAEAPAALRLALGRALARSECDVLLLVRGGGSLEDLWAFNDEALARAVAASPIPVISGVGHETDFTIADFVADLRAPTPTAAAELACVDRGDLIAEVQALGERAGLALERSLARAAQRLDLAMVRLRPPSAKWRERAHRLGLLQARLLSTARENLSRRQGRLERAEARMRSPSTEAAQLRLDAACARLHQSFSRLSAVRETRARELSNALELVSPLAVLARGYAIVEDSQGRVLRDIEGLVAGSDLNVRLERAVLRTRLLEAVPISDPAAGIRREDAPPEDSQP